MSLKCDAVIVLGDDYGDNDCTFHCKLEKDHLGDHSEGGDIDGQKYTMTWERGG